MQPFVINNHGRMVFPSNFMPDLDFSVIDSLDQLEKVIRRDFEAKAPSGTEILRRIEAGDHYRTRFELMRDVALNLFWTNRFAMTMYDKRPTRWRDVPRNRDDVFLPVLAPWQDAERKVAAVQDSFAALPAAWDAGVEDLDLRRAVRRAAPPAVPRDRAAGGQADGGGDPRRSEPADLLDGVLQPGLPDVRLPADPRLRAGRARAGGAAPVGDGAAQPVPLGPGPDPADPGRRAARRGLRRGVPPAQPRGARLHPPRDAGRGAHRRTPRLRHRARR